MDVMWKACFHIHLKTKPKTNRWICRDRCDERAKGGGEEKRVLRREQPGCRQIFVGEKKDNKRGTSFKANLILGKELKIGSQIVCSYWGNFSPPTLTAVSPVTFKDAINNVWWSSLHAIGTWHVRALSQCVGHRGRRAHSDDKEHFKNKCIFKRSPFLTERQYKQLNQLI